MADRFEPIHARRFAYHPTDWRLRFWDASTGAGGSPFAGADYGVPVEQLQALLPGKFVVHTPRVRGGYPQREGLGRTVVWYAGVFKSFGWRDFLAYAEQYGRPLRFGVFGTGKDPKLPQASPEDVDELELALQNLSSAIVSMFPDTTRPEVIPPPGEGHAVHPELLRLCDEETSKAVVGGTLTTTGGTKGGNRALGDVHKEEELILFRGDARAIAETLRDQFLTPLVVLNGVGERRDVPTLHFDVEPPDTLDQLATRFKTLKETGVRMGARHIRARFEIPDPQDGEEIVGGPPPAPPPPAPGTATPTPAGAPQPPKPPKKKPGKKPAPAQPADEQP
jgi:phage gp29-like protein